MTFPTISTLPPAPQRTQDPNTFSATADAFVAALPTLVTEINTAGDFIDTNTILVGNAFQGTYSAGTTYSLGQSVLSAGKYYVSLVNSNTGNTPASSPSQWSELNMMAKQEALFPLETTALDTQTFNTSGNWTKPSTGTYAFVQLWGGGGSGGRGASVTAGGGGGGSYRAGVFKLSDLGSTVAVTVGAGGAKVGTGVQANGNVGGNTTFGTLLTAFGGGGGRGNTPVSTSAGGGGGAGTGAAGATATSATGAKGGVSATPASILYYFLQNGPSIINFSSDSFFEPGGDGNSTAVINPITFFSGGGGGAGIFNANGGNGTPSFLGGGGGGGAYASSGGGSGGTSVLGGNGGAGGTSGTAGSQPAGGGGGSTVADSGAGGAGRCIVTVF